MTPPSKPQPIQPASGIGLFSLALINIVAIASLRDLPQMAEYGLGAIFFYSFAALFFFVPVSLVAAELASAWSQSSYRARWRLCNFLSPPLQPGARRTKSGGLK